MITIPIHRIIVLLFCFGPLSAGAVQKSEWPPISTEELAMKDCPGSPGVPAIILYRESHVDDTKSFETHYYRIKIFADDGKKYADIEIPYLEKLAQIEDIRARSVRPD